MKKWIKKFLYALIVAMILGGFLVHFYLPRAIVEINNPLILLVTKGSWNHPEPAPRIEGFTYETIHGYGHTDLSVMTYGKKIDSVKGAVILLHGIRAGKEHFSEKMKWLYENGFRAYAMDLRAHGSSDGKFTTFGVKERHDVSALVDYVDKSGFENIGIWGQSLGAAVAMQSMGIDKRIDYGIIESTFTDFRTITHDYTHFHLGTNFKPLTNYLIDRSGKMADFEPENASPFESAAQINQPILMVHGNEDQRIDISYGRENFSNLASEQKNFIEIDGANHLNVWKIGGEPYLNQVLKFMNDHSAID
ncbi:MAG: alpha/beta fold hydrolase [Nonlabens sp.]